MAPPRYYRKVIRIRAEDSPNVKAGRVVYPGVLDLDRYRYRRTHWDPVRQCIGLDAMFYEGAEVLLYPPDWLNHSEALADMLVGADRKAEAMGIDPGEGGANTAWSIVDKYGLVFQLSYPTPDTSDIEGQTVALIQEHKILPQRVGFDRGGGGLQIAQQMRKRGYQVQTVAFGESVTPEPHRGRTPTTQRKEQQEERYTYLNRRAEMYGMLREDMDPSREIEGTRPGRGGSSSYSGVGENGGASGRLPRGTLTGFAIPAKYTELRRQLSLMPLLWDSEGRMRMLPKTKRNPNSTEQTLTELLGCSPDEADSLVVANYMRRLRKVRTTAGAVS